MVSKKTTTGFYRAMERICRFCEEQSIKSISFKGLVENKQSTQLYSKFSSIIDSSLNASGEPCYLFEMKHPYYF